MNANADFLAGLSEARDGASLDELADAIGSDRPAVPRDLAAFTVTEIECQPHEFDRFDDARAYALERLVTLDGWGEGDAWFDDELSDRLAAEYSLAHEVLEALTPDMLPTGATLTVEVLGWRLTIQHTTPRF